MSLEHQQKSRSRPPRIYDASLIICPSQFHDINNGVEETKTKTNKCHDDAQEVKETAPREASCAFKPGRSAASGVSIHPKINKVSNGFDKSPKRPRQDSFCASDDETFLRSPARRCNENSILLMLHQTPEVPRQKAHHRRLSVPRR